MSLSKNSKIAILLVVAFLLGLAAGMGVMTLFPKLWEPPFQNATIEFPTGSLLNIKTDEVFKRISKTIGSNSDIFYISDDTPSISLNTEGEIQRLSFSVLIPEQGSSNTSYMMYQLRVDEPGELLIVKCNAVPEPRSKISMSAFWDALSNLPIGYIKNHVEGKPDLYMLTVFGDKAIDNTMYLKDKILYYNRNGLIDEVALRPQISGIITPMYLQSGGGFHSEGSDSFMLYYCG